MDEQQQKKYVQMTQTPVSRLIPRLALPCIISMLVTAFYNMADTFFVGMLKSNAATGAVGVVFSLMAIIQAIGFFFGQGSGNFISRAIGQKNYEESSDMASTGFFSALAAGVLICALGLIFLKPLAYLLGSTDTILPYTKAYLRVILLGAPWMTSSLVLNNQLRFQGSAAYAMVGITVGAVLNIGLDPLLIFVFDLGIAGAAWATIISQFVSFCLLLVGCGRGGNIRIDFAHLRMKPYYYLWIFKGGLPSLARQGLASVATICLNQAARPFGDAAIAAQKVGTQIESISYTTAEGFATAVNAFIAQNFGARRLDRICRGYWTAVGMIVAWSCFTTVMLVVFPAPLVRVFIQKEEVVRTGVSYLRIMGYSQILMCLEITSSGAFQGLGRPMPPTLAGVIGNAARIPMAILLSATVLGLDGVWWSISISSIAKGLVVFAWFVVVLHRCTRDGDLGAPRFIR